MRKAVLAAILSAAIMGLCSCGDDPGSVPGSGTASRAEVSYPADEESGIHFGGELVISGEWTEVTSQ